LDHLIDALFEQGVALGFPNEHLTMQIGSDDQGYILRSISRHIWQDVEKKMMSKITASPDDHESRSKLAQHYLEQQSWAKLEVLTRAQTWPFSLMHVKALIGKKSVSEAYKEIEALLKDHPANPTLVLQKSRVLEMLGYSVPSRGALSTVDCLVLNDQDVAVYLKLCLKLRQYEDVVRVCSMFASMGRNLEWRVNVDTLTAKAKALVELQKYQEALECCARIMQFPLKERHKNKVIALAARAMQSIEQFEEAFEASMWVYAQGEADYWVERGAWSTLVSNVQGKKQANQQEGIRTSHNESHREIIKQEEHTTGESKKEIRLKPDSEAKSTTGAGNRTLASPWVEGGIVVNLCSSDGAPIKITINNPTTIPYLERLPWVHTVQHLSLRQLAPFDQDPAFRAIAPLLFP